MRRQLEAWRERVEGALADGRLSEPPPGFQKAADRMAAAGAAAAGKSADDYDEDEDDDESDLSGERALYRGHSGSVKWGQVQAVAVADSRLEQPPTMRMMLRATRQLSEGCI